jgi:pyruvate carboxylase subunit B
MYREKMREKGWETGADDEELFQYAMHPTQYEAFRSGEAKMRFEDELAKKRSAAAPVAAPASLPSKIEVEVGGERYAVSISYPEAGDTSQKTAETKSIQSASTEMRVINAPLEGKFFLTKNPGERGIQPGDAIQKGDTVAYVEAMKVINAISSEFSGTVAEILVQSGSDVEEDQPIIKLK